MKFTTDADRSGGTFLVGRVQATRSQLVEVFGQPMYTAADSGDGKVTTEWVLEFDEGTVATVYDWKRYELGTPGLNEEIMWNVGGHSPRAATLVQEALAS
jgi:hypothetical protein